MGGWSIAEGYGAAGAFPRPPLGREAARPCSDAGGKLAAEALEGLLHVGEELVDALVLGGEGVAQGDGRGAAVVELEVDPVGGEVAAQVLGAGDDGAAQVGAGRGRRRRDRRAGGVVVDEAAQEARSLELEAQTVGRADVVVGEGQAGDARVVQADTGALGVAGEELVLRGSSLEALDLVEGEQVKA